MNRKTGFSIGVVDGKRKCIHPDCKEWINKAAFRCSKHYTQWLEEQKSMPRELRREVTFEEIARWQELFLPVEDGYDGSSQNV